MYRKELALAQMDAVRKGEAKGHDSEELTRENCTRERPPPQPPRGEVRESEGMEAIKYGQSDENGDGVNRRCVGMGGEGSGVTA